MINQRQNIFDLKYGSLRGQKEDGTIVDFLNTESPSDLKIYETTFSADDYINAAFAQTGFNVFEFPNNGKYIQIDNVILQKTNGQGQIAPSDFTGQITLLYSSDGSTPENDVAGFSEEFYQQDRTQQFPGINAFIFNTGYYVFACYEPDTGAVKLIPKTNYALLNFVDAPVNTSFKNDELISSSNGGTASVWFQDGEDGNVNGIWIYDMLDNNGDPTNGQFFVGTDIVGVQLGGTASIDTADDYSEGKGSFKLIISYREYEI